MVSPCADGPEDEEPLADPYEVVSISVVSTPTGCTGTEWHRYEISQGGNRIVGFRAGGSDAVHEAVEAIVAHLNRRRRGRRGRVHMTLGPTATPRPS